MNYECSVCVVVCMIVSRGTYHEIQQPSQIKLDTRRSFASSSRRLDPESLPLPRPHMTTRVLLISSLLVNTSDRRDMHHARFGDARFGGMSDHNKTAHTRTPTQTKRGQKERHLFPHPQNSTATVSELSQAGTPRYSSKSSLSSVLSCSCCPFHDVTPHAHRSL